MRAHLIPLLACPDCLAAIERTGTVDGNPTGLIQDGTLACTACNRTFPIAGGIASLMPKSLLPEQESEIVARDAQVSDYDAMWFLNLFGAFEIPMTLRRLNIRPGQLVLEAGSGTGRMTPTVAQLAGQLVSIDFSLASLQANSAKLRTRGVSNVDLIQADLCHLPFQPGVFDRVLSCQVLEHVPGHDARSEAISGISRCAAPDATVVISAYQHSMLTREKQGSHDGGIPFFRFTRSEFRDLLASRFAVHSITGKLVYLYLACCQNIESHSAHGAAIQPLEPVGTHHAASGGSEWTSPAAGASAPAGKS